MRKIGLIGVGTMGTVHASAYLRMPDVTLAGVYDIDPARAGAFVQSHNATLETFPTADALIAAVDVVDVCTPTQRHAEYVLAALYAGRDVVCEKPMARTLGECDQLIEAARATGRTLMPAQVVRFFPEFRSAYDLVNAGAVGRPATIRTRRGGGFPRATNDWYADPSQSGGVTLDTIIHDFDWLRWTFGPVERVYAKMATFDSKLDHLDYSLVTLRFTNGAIAHVEGTWADPGGFAVGLEIAGDAGLIHFDSREAVPLRVSRREVAGQTAGVAVPESPTINDPYYLELRHFVDALNAGRTPDITPEDGRAAVEIALAALQSAQTGKPVRLTDAHAKRKS